MRIERRSTLAEAWGAEGIVVVIDVLRAFTSASLMFRYGASEVVLVATPEEAIEFRSQEPRYLVAGEIDGAMIDGFDLGNSPSEIIVKGRKYFSQRSVVLRSSSGSQGAVAASSTAQEIIVAGYTTASAVARYIKAKPSEKFVTLLAMGVSGREKAVEDEWCGNYIEHLLASSTYDHVIAMWDCLQNPLIASSLLGRRQNLPKEDVMLSLQRDLFDFAMVGRRAGNCVIVKPVWA